VNKDYTDGYYESVTEGECGTLVCRVGTWNGGEPEGWEIIGNRDGWVYYLSVNNDNCLS
jgi:hypothetical protein